MKPRVLHVVRPSVRADAAWRAAASGASADTDLGSDALVALAAQTVARTPEFEHAAITIGDREALDRCAALGLRPQHAVPTPAGSLTAASRSLARLVRAAPPGLVHAWGTGARAAAASLDRFAPLTHTDAYASDDRRTRLTTPGACATPGDLVLPPGPSRDDARARDGLDAGMIVVVFLSDAPGDVDAGRSIVAGGLARVTCGPLTFVFPEHAQGVARGSLFRRRTGLPWRPLVTPDPVLAAARHADLACVALPTNRERVPGGLALAAGACLAAGIPVIAPPRARDALGSLPELCRAGGDAPADLFKAIYRIASSPSRLQEAREETIRYTRAEPSAFTESLTAQWAEHLQRKAATP